MHFGLMSAILLYSDHRHVSATHMAIFSVASARIQIYLQCVAISALLKLYCFVYNSDKWQNTNEYKIL